MNDIINMFVRREGLSMATVVVKNGNVDGALRTLKQKNAKDGSSKKVRERQEGYLKPGAKRRKEKAENIKNSRKKNRNNYFFTKFFNSHHFYK